MPAYPAAEQLFGRQSVDGFASAAEGGEPMYSIYFYRVYETGVEIDLNKLDNRLPTVHTRTRFTRVKIKSMQMDNPPLLLNLAPGSFAKGQYSLQFNVWSRIYDIGAISICLEYANAGNSQYSLDELADLLSGQEGLEALFAEKVRAVVEILAPFLGSIEVDSEFYEDYTIYTFPQPDYVLDPAALLMGERIDFSAQVREQITRNRLSYGARDYAIMGWDAALLCDVEDTSDLRDLIEFANVQLLELRYYDTVLSTQMERMYEDIEQAEKHWSYRRLRQIRRISTTLMSFIAETTEVAEKIGNLIKITEDVYYARVYETTLKVLRTEQWTDSVNRKLKVMVQNYSLLVDEVNIQHSNFLEWIIIILIALEFGFAILTSFWQ